MLISLHRPSRQWYNIASDEVILVCLLMNNATGTLLNPAATSVWFEPTSTSKCTRIFPALVSIMNSDSFVSPTAPVTYASPNTFELIKMYEHAKDNELISSQKHWERLSSFGLAANYRTALEQLTARSASIAPGRTVPLDFISKEGIAQMAVHLLPYFQHLVVKCGERGTWL